MRYWPAEGIFPLRNLSMTPCCNPSRRNSSGSLAAEYLKAVVRKLSS
ncbi:hypothetical protein KCP74_17600 [Salmonella enterica subsp. enterica]|nr:hypothetical protein KCP74_17600 [Salmonella enterica subsp. enterica]